VRGTPRALEQDIAAKSGLPYGFTTAATTAPSRQEHTIMTTNIRSLAFAAVYLTAPVFSTACVMEDPDELDDLGDESVAEEVTNDPEAVADPGFAGEPGAMFLKEGEADVGSDSLTTPVTLYKDINYTGASQTLQPGVYHSDKEFKQLSFGGDALSSLKIPSGMTAKLYEHTFYRGAALTLKGNTPDLRTRGFNDRTDSIAVYGPISEGTGSPYSLGGTTDVENLKYKVASNPTVIKRLAYFANMLGFGLCGGTQSQYLGENFDVSRNADGSYSMQAHYNKNDPYAGGYWADKRLKITLSNFRITIDPATFKYGKPAISSLTPIALDTGLATNPNSTESTITVALNSSHTDSYAHETNVSFTQGIKVGIKNKAKVPLFGESEVTTEFSFSATEGWKNTSTTTNVVGTTWTYSAKVPARSKKLITLVGSRSKSDISYSAVARITFDVSFYGFLRWSGNARSDHPTNRPFVTAKFGTDSTSGLDVILDQYDHAYIANYSGWDWDWIKAIGNSYIGSTMGFFRRGITVPLTGKFKGVVGTNVSFMEGKAQPL
jgi:hypothetical protein